MVKTFYNLKAECMKGVHLRHSAVDDGLVLAFLGKCTKHPIPDDEKHAIVFVQSVFVHTYKVGV